VDVSRRELREALAETCTSLADLAESLAPGQWSLPTGCPGWTVFDQVAHVSSLETVMSGEPEPTHAAPAAPHIRNSIGTIMENLVDRRRGWQPAELIAELRAAAARRQQQLVAVDDDPDATLPGPTGKPMPAEIGLLLRTFDCVAHEQDVRRAVGRPGGLDGLAGRVVAHGIPQLLSMGWQHDGPVALVVDGVTTVVPLGSEEPPRATLTCSLVELVALTTGRSDATAPVVDGDSELAGRVVARLAITP
jgi:uncharacterized protein (TIGR03083 family)